MNPTNPLSADGHGTPRSAEPEHVNSEAPRAAFGTFLGDTVEERRAVLKSVVSNRWAVEGPAGMTPQDRLKAVEAFRKHCMILREGEDIDLRECRMDDLLAADVLHDRKTAAGAARVLEEQGLLRPVISLPYSSSRGLDAQGASFGLDMHAFISHFTKHGDGSLVLECGSGSGMGMYERRMMSYGQNQEIGICNAAYYPLDTLLAEIVDFDALAAEGAVLDAAGRSAFARSLYKTLVIRAGGTEEVKVPYDWDVETRLIKSIDELPSIVREKAHLMPAAKAFPSDSCTLDETGEIIHPKSEPLPEAVREAAAVFAASPDRFLRVGPGKADIREFLPLFPAGELYGNLPDDLTRLRAAQVDILPAFYVTPFFDSQQYKQFARETIRLLKNDGAAFDNGLRNNFAADYGLEELAAVARETGYPIRVIAGKGQPSDPLQEDAPLAALFTTDIDKLAYIEANLAPGFRITTPEALLADPVYVASLQRPTHRSGGPATQHGTFMKS